LRPLTWHRPKVLCPVAGVPLLDRNLARVRAATGSVAVNVHHHRDQIEEHLALTEGDRVHVSREEAQALGTAGALGHLRDWIADRPVLVVNGDAWTEVAVAPLLAGWDGETVRLLVPGPPRSDFEPTLPLAGALVPWADVARLRAEPAGLYREVMVPAAAGGWLELVPGSGRFVDCGTPASYLAANLTASGGSAVVGDGAQVAGEVERSVLWSGAVVRQHERLVDAIRTGTGLTVLVR
jgi:MurNAc alpha-1-phosphate uridylyltransferase